MSPPPLKVGHLCNSDCGARGPGGIDQPPVIVPFKKLALVLNDLAPRIQALRHQEDQLVATRTELEELMVTRKMELADVGLVRSHVEDLRELLSNSPLSEQKAFIRSFVREIRVTGKEVLLTYTIPLLPEGCLQEAAGVLDIVHYGGAGGTRTHDLLTASQTLSL